MFVVVVVAIFVVMSLTTRGMSHWAISPGKAMELLTLLKKAVIFITTIPWEPSVFDFDSSSCRDITLVGTGTFSPLVSSVKAVVTKKTQWSTANNYEYYACNIAISHVSQLGLCFRDALSSEPASRPWWTCLDWITHGRLCDGKGLANRRRSGRRLEEEGRRALHAEST